MPIMSCSGHDWTSNKGYYCRYCLQLGITKPENWRDRDWTNEKFHRPCKVKSDSGTLYACHPYFLPLSSDHVYRHTFQYLEDDLGLE